MYRLKPKGMLPSVDSSRSRLTLIGSLLAATNQFPSNPLRHQRRFTMKSIIAAALLAIVSASVMADVHVRGYYRDNGTYVQPHVRTAPDSNPCNNYSSRC
jgi:hypothetical protein